MPARPPTPTLVLALDLAIGLGTAQRQVGDPAFRDTLLDAARRAADVGDTERMVAAALANNRGFFSTAGAIDTDKVELLEPALDRLARDAPDRALVLAALCSELALATPWTARQALAHEAVAIARSAGDDATIVRVLNNVAFAAPGAARARTVVGPDGRCPGPGRAGRRPRSAASSRPRARPGHHRGR